MTTKTLQLYFAALDFGVAVNVFWRELEAQFYDPRDPYGNKAEWRPLIGRGPSRYCAVIGWDSDVAMSVLKP